MSVYPVMLDGTRFAAVVVGGGQVAARKVRSLLDGGLRVTVVAPEMAIEITRMAATESRLQMIRATYDPSHIQQAMIVVAATDDALVNQRIADDASRLGRLVNVVDDPDSGNFTTAAVHRSGDLTVAVSAGGVPGAAAAVRDAIAARFDARYASAIGALKALRDRMLGSGRRDEWKKVSSEVIDEGFCESVENGTVDKRLAPWR